jgi:hypothetical protein
VTGRPAQEGGALLRMDDHRKRGPRRRRVPLLAYCLGSGGVGAAVATALSVTVAGAARLPVWSAVAGSVSVLAGLAYGSTLPRAAWAACRRLSRRRGA